ncbi:MAG TPA: SDR family oxidoreductase [Candidatus Nanopelagicaceae bacterium]|nr:SDR family oxidoreductase [Candidatus Nanopelagicaceae bacterium]
MQEPPEVDLIGTRVLITGSTSGLGRAMAGALAAAGAWVVVTGRDATRARAVATEVGTRSGRTLGLALDVREPASVQAGVAAAISELGGLDVLINNAGLGMRSVNPNFLTQAQPFWAVSPDGFRDLVDTNLTGYFLMARQVVPHFLGQQHGRIVNVTMNQATMRRRGFVPYGPARAGADALSEIMAADLADTPITVNQLLPGGATATGMIPADTPAEIRARLLPSNVMDRAICWLCSQAASDVRNQRIVATGFDQWLVEWEAGTP